MSTIINTAWDYARLRSIQKHPLVHLSDWQRQQWRFFLEMGFPTRQMENWKYTDVTAIACESFMLGKPSDPDLQSLFIDDLPRLVFVNGYFRPSLSYWGNDIASVTCVPIMTALKHDYLSLESLSLLPEYQTPFSLLNDALFQEGVFFRIKEDVCVTKPIQLIYWTDAQAQPMISNIRNYFILDSRASAIFFENYIGCDHTSYLNNVVNQILVNASAQLKWYTKQSEGNQAYHIANTVIHQAEDSHVCSYHLGLGSVLSRDNVSYSLNMLGAKASLNGLYYPKSGQHIDYHTRVDHRVSACVSHQAYKGILGHGARVVFNGKIKVYPAASESQATQTSRHLLLSDQARVDAKPELEIYHDDVICSHAATVGQLDQDVLFYLRSRGVSESLAIKIMIAAFAEDILACLPIDPWANVMRDALRDRFIFDGMSVLK